MLHVTICYKAEELSLFSIRSKNKSVDFKGIGKKLIIGKKKGVF